MTRPTEEEIVERAAKLILEERRAGVQKWFYMSYAKEAAQGGFQGGIYTFAHGPVEAMTRAGILGVSPGGEVACVECPVEHLPPPEFRERLLSKAELEAATGEEFLSLKDLEEEEDNDA
jgi:hypothetical protein